MQANSAANSAPASRPPRERAVARRRARCRATRPRARPGSPRRPSAAAAWQRAGTRQRHLRGDLVQAPEYAAEDAGRDGEARRGAIALRSSATCRTAHSLLRSPASEQGGADSFGVPFAPSSYRQAHRASTSRAAITPAARPLAWANGAMAMSQPAGWRSAGPHGASLHDLDASAPSRPAPIARRGPRACSDQCTAAHGDAGVQHAGQAAVVEQVAVAPAAPRCVSGQASSQADAAAARHARDDAERARPAARRPGWRPGAARSSGRTRPQHARQGSPGRAPAASRARVGGAARGSASARAEQREPGGEPRARRPAARSVEDGTPERDARRRAAPPAMSGSNCVGCSSSRARCWARRSSR